LKIVKAELAAVLFIAVDKIFRIRYGLPRPFGVNGRWRMGFGFCPKGINPDLMPDRKPIDIFDRPQCIAE
jgi:hypothetical protein